MITELTYKVPVQPNATLLEELSIWVINNLVEYTISTDPPIQNILMSGRQLGKSMMFNGYHHHYCADVVLTFQDQSDLNYFNMIFRDQLEPYKISTMWMDTYKG